MVHSARGVKAFFFLSTKQSHSFFFPPHPPPLGAFPNAQNGLQTHLLQGNENQPQRITQQEASVRRSDASSKTGQQMCSYLR